MHQSNRPSTRLIQGLWASVSAGLAGAALYGVVSVSHFGLTALAFAAIAFAACFLIMILLIFPLMWIGGRVGEPWFFLVMLGCGFFGAITGVNLVIGNSILDSSAWQPWLIASYGVTGAISTFAAWLYLFWRNKRENS